MIKLVFLCLFSAQIWALGAKDSLRLSEGFEGSTQGGFSPAFTENSPHFWGVASRVQVNNTYTGITAKLDACPNSPTGLANGEGNQFIAVQRQAASYTSQAISAANWDSAFVDLSLAACDYLARFDAGDSVAIYLSTRLKGSNTFQNQLISAFVGTGNSFNNTGSDLTHATLGKLTAAQKHFRFKTPIAADVDSIRVFIRINVNAGSEEVAFDDLKIYTHQSGVPYRYKDLKDTVILDRDDSLDLRLLDYYKDAGREDTTLTFGVQVLGTTHGSVQIINTNQLKIKPTLHDLGTNQIQISVKDEFGLEFLDTIQVVIKPRLSRPQLLISFQDSIPYASQQILGTSSPSTSLISMISVDTAVCQLKQDTLISKKVGSCQINVQQKSDSLDWQDIDTTISITIVPKTIQVVANQQSKIYGTVDSALSYSSVGLLVGDTLTGVLFRDVGEDVGEYLIQSNLSHPNYTINFIGDTLKITPALLTVQVDSASKVYGSQNPALTYNLLGLVDGDDETAVENIQISTAATEFSSVGSYLITAQGGVAQNYTLQYVLDSLIVKPAPLKIQAIAQSKVYGTLDPDLDYTSEGLLNNDELMGGLSRDSGENAGFYPIRSTLDHPNYTIQYIPDSFEITKAPVTVTAFFQSKTYGEADPTLSYNVVGLLNLDTLEGDLTRDVGENAGTYQILSALSSNNYEITYIGDSMQIHPALVYVEAHKKTKVYGEVDPELTYSVTGLLNSDTLGGNLTRIAGEDVNIYEIQSALQNPNYSIMFTPESLTVTPANLKIIAQRQTKVYGNSDPDLSYTTEGLLNQDILSGYLSREQGEDIGKYAIMSTLSSLNYTITYVPDSLEITKAPLSIVADKKTKVYGEADPELTYTVDGLINSDELSGALSRESGEDVGSYAIQSTLSHPNYTMNYTASTLEITKASQTIHVDTIPNQLLSSNSIYVGGVASSSLNNILMTKTPEVCSVGVDTVYFVQFGMCEIEVSQPGNKNYLPADPVTLSFRIDGTTPLQKSMPFESLFHATGDVQIFDLSGVLQFNGRLKSAEDLFTLGLAAGHYALQSKNQRVLFQIK